MDFGASLRDLGQIDANRLIEATTALEESTWFEQDHRQSAYDVHKDTSSIVLLFCDDAWPDVTVKKDLGWPTLGEVAEPLMNEIIGTHYEPGGQILRAMAARLHAGCNISPHVDHLPSFHAGHRIHLPLVSNAGVRYVIGGQPFTMEVGRAYEINNQKPHSVMNAGQEARVNFIFDYVPPNS